MASCLYECLCEAGLEKYYPHFAAFGVQTIDELAEVSMEDFSKLGVHDINDRKHLFHLIRIIKFTQQEGTANLSKQDFQPHGLFIQPQVTKSGPRRQLRFESFCGENDGTVKDSEPELYQSSDFSADEEKDNVGEMLGHIPPHNPEPIRLTRRDLNIAGIGSKNDLSCPTVSDDIAPLLGDSEVPPVQRVTHISGYNYGLPHSCIRSNTFDKETPWTESEKIRVCVRKRPLCVREERRGEANIITVKDQETLLLHEKKEAVDLTQYILQHVFCFDEVFEESCTNQDVYMKTAYPLIQHIFNGGNATCFAYGQTGAGKTYTMIGNHRNPGLYALAAQDIFRYLEASPSRKELVVLISFYEIYCGHLYDLLNGRQRLFAREDGKHVVQIVGLREVQVDSVDELLEVILKGGKERSTGVTAVNSDSSRSHAIIQIQIKDTSNRAFGRISFIDLAGSERAADAKEKDRQTKMEGAEINQSLLALKECIRALDQEQVHTPFRQSKLTLVLKDSFIGNSKTCMIANVSPSNLAAEHTLNTLRYADRVKELKKGIRYPAPVTKRRRKAGTVSPRHIPGSPFLPPGEKSSPKKVKLGLQHPSSAAKPKAYPATLQPPGVPLTSTPKGTGKGHAYIEETSTPCFHHTTPVKGVLEITHPLKKSYLSPLPEKSSSVEDFISTEESGQQDKYMQNRTPVQCLKVQTVQPLQKQFVPNDNNSSGDGNLQSEQEWGNTFPKQSVEAWTYLPPYQKEREEHLRLYHQQFQQPPILKQKLNYQPLERFLIQYKPEEIQLKQELSLPPTEGQSKEWIQQEDLDDSDFSEDSFSPVCSQKSVKRGNSSKSSQHSFFLHEREQGTEEEQKGQKRQDLFFKYSIPTEERGLDDSWDCSEGRSAVEEPLKNAGCSKTPADWNYDLAEFPPSNTAEKPYCLQEDPACSWRNSKDFLADHKEFKSKHRRIVYSSEATLTPETDASTPCVSPVLKSGTPECKEFDPQHEEKEESTLAKKATLVGGGVNWKAQKNGVSHSVSSSSSDFTSELMTPLRVSPLDGEDTTETEKVTSNQEQPHGEKQVPDSDAQSRFEEEDWQCTRSRSMTDSMLELAEQPGHGERLCALLGSSQATNKKLPPTCGRVKPCCCHLRSVLSKQGVRRSLFVERDLTETSTAGSTAGSAVPGPETPSRESSRLQQPKPGLRNEDLTHFEDPAKSSFGSEETGLLKNKPKQSIFTQETFAADAGFATKDNKPIANAKCPSQVSSSCSPSAASEMGKWQKEALEKAQKTLIRAHQQQLDELAHLCFKEECLINQMSAMDRDAVQEIQLEYCQISFCVIDFHTQQLNFPALGKLTPPSFSGTDLRTKAPNYSQLESRDFQNFMAMLDEILVLKSKCVQTMRAQLQLCSASPGTDKSLQTRPPV